MPELNPNQFAIPGMEHHAHPWAQHLAHGMQLHFEHEGVDSPDAPPSSSGVNTLYAYGHNPHARHYTNPDPQRAEEWQHIHGVLQWQDRTPSSMFGPGEIQWVENTGKYNLPENEQHKVRGIAGAMMRSAHHFDFGQDTKPVHSPSLTEEGEKFSRKVMPELRASPRSSVGAKQWNLPGGFEHPYQKKEREESLARVQAMRAEGAKRRKKVSMKNPNPETGVLF